MFTVWNAYGADCADVESPSRSESHYLAEFPTEQQAQDFAANAYEVLIAQCPEWQSLAVFVTEWNAPEGAPVMVADIFTNLTAHHLEELVGGKWEIVGVFGDNGNRCAVAPIFAFMDNRKVDVIVTDSETGDAPDTATEQIEVTVYEYPNGNEIESFGIGNVTPTPEGIARAVQVALGIAGITCQ